MQCVIYGKERVSIWPDVDSGRNCCRQTSRRRLCIIQTVGKGRCDLQRVLLADISAADEATLNLILSAKLSLSPCALTLEPFLNVCCRSDACCRVNVRANRRDMSSMKSLDFGSTS